ncbi:MAG: hypothetical protein LBU95_02215 [Rikenellaceae bacterium]|jgi:hypothetical protein|nr:hypothetical protein [Rikenellaceae bacterium]
MKSLKDVRTRTVRDADESIRKAQKLDPIKKSGKERHHMMGELDEEDDILDYRKRESVLDYFDDGEEE